MANAIAAIRGMNDILPNESFLWQAVEAILRETLHQYGYEEIRVPILEKTELFKRSIGEATDIVEKEMYTFLDRNNESLTLRPEGTASCVRAGIEHGLFHNQIQRLWYLGPYYRYERPQKGRYRQFYQCGAEVFGLEGPDIDAELILLSARLLEKLGLSAHVTLELNSLGSPESRKIYREVLVDYFKKNQNLLDEDSVRRLVTNPLRILDSKNPAMQSLIENAPKLINHLDDASTDHFEKLQALLKIVNVPFVINPRLVRGLDYYTKTVFEWTTTELGAQSAVCSGGRYDGLIEQLGGKPTPALGFAIGMERIILLMQQLKPFTPKPTDIYVIADSELAFQEALKLSDEIRQKFPAIRLMLNCGGGSFKSQFKKADKSGARIALIIGEEEQKTKSISLKFLREEKPQETLKTPKILETLQQLFCVS